MPRAWRIAILLTILLGAIFLTVGERFWVRGWHQPLRIAIYPVAMDDTAQAYLQGLNEDGFREVGDYLTNESARWKHASAAPRIRLMPPIHERPPLEGGRSGLEAIKLSLRLRGYAFRNTPFWQSLGTVRLFLLYHEARPGEALPHSLGMEKGLIGMVHVFADDTQRARNNVVIAHELLHTLGAKDKYDAEGQPLYPAGYADPYAQPRLPQEKAEIMAGRVALSETEARIPDSLADTLIGYATAAEIGW